MDDSLDSDIFHHIEQSKGDVPVVFLNGLDGIMRRIKGMRNFMADKHIHHVLGHRILLEQRQVKNTSHRVERGSSVVTSLNLDILFGQKFGQRVFHRKVGSG